jgi:uncharacterized protein (TIGR03084 family)
MIDATAPLPQALDFRDECDALYAVLVDAPAAAWSEPTQFKGWTFDDVIGHLHHFDVAAECAARSRDELQAFLAPVMAGRAAGRSFADCTREWLDGLAGPALLERWRGQYLRLADLYAVLPADARLPWAGPDMSARSFMSARQMEAWAHGQAVFDALGRDRREHDRLRNVAIMGINTFGWSYQVRRRPVPPAMPCVRLQAPSGATWEWGDVQDDERIEGTAVDFCRVVAQTRNVRDTPLHVRGPVAQEWMSIAQCFAGPPEPPPAPGTRFRRVSPTAG